VSQVRENLPGKISLKRRKIKLPRYSHLNKQSIVHFDNFVESTSPLRLSHSLRDLFLLHLSYEDAMPSKLHELSADLYFLLHFLDKVGEEMQGKIAYYDGKKKNPVSAGFFCVCSNKLLPLVVPAANKLRLYDVK
jgi:hypothetical protein